MHPAAAARLTAAQQEVFRPVAARLQALAEAATPEAQRTLAEAFQAELPQLAEAVMAQAPELASVLEEIIGTAVVDGFATAAQAKAPAIITNTYDPGQPRDDQGQWGEGSGGASAKGSAPARSSVAEADRRLTAGFTVQASDGRSVRFGPELKAKLDRQPDGTYRKTLLPHAEDTVRTGKAVEATVKSEARRYYAKLYSGQDSPKGMLVVVDASDGYAFNLFPAKSGYLSKKIGNRSGETVAVGSDAGEQPPVEVLQALAAAGLLKDLSLPSAKSPGGQA